MHKYGDLIRYSGHRATGQRILLLELIQKSIHHMDADELYRLARVKYPRISLSTVYRNLQVFKEMELVKDHGFSESHRHYESKPAAEHHHVVCRSCGRIVEFTNHLVKNVITQVEREHGFTIDSADVQLQGTCPECLSHNGGTLK
ncbi:Fur family transcriptional regulator [Chloroflexota bacterium]